MITWIGLCAGEIWHHLDNHGKEADLESIYAGVKAPRETVLMAVGWLAREGYVLIDGDFPNPKLKLNPNPRSG